MEEHPVEKKPHPVFAALWLVWFGFVVAALAMPERTTFGLWVLLAFLPIEGVAVALDTKARDTLSETMTWLQRKLSKHRRFARGWNALILMVVLLISILLARTAWTYSGSWLITSILGVLTTVWLYDHWMSPDVHG